MTVQEEIFMEKETEKQNLGSGSIPGLFVDSGKPPVRPRGTVSREFICIREKVVNCRFGFAISLLYKLQNELILLSNPYRKNYEN